MRKIMIFLLFVPLIAAASSCSDNAIKYYNLGVRAADSDDMKSAVEYWGKSLSYREDPDAYYNLGSAYLILEEYEKAIENLEKSTAMRKDDHTAHYKLGLAYQKTGQIPKAKKSYKFSIQLKQNYTLPYIGMAECALAQNSLITAEKYASSALMLTPDNDKASILFAETMYRMGKFSEAYLHLLPLRNTANSEILFLLGKVMYARRMYIDAYETLSKARDLGETGDQIFYLLGLSSMKLKNPVEAENYFRLALYENEDNCAAKAALAKLNADKEHFEEAARFFTEAERCDPADPRIKGDFGEVLLRMGHSEKALEKLQIAVNDMDEPGIYLFYLGNAYLVEGEKLKARETLDEFIESWDGDEEIRQRAQGLIEDLE